MSSAQNSRYNIFTNSGMLCLWDRAAFAGISDYTSWEKELCEDADIIRHISAGSLVPVSSGSDGASAAELRVFPDTLLTARENEYILVPSRPYLLNTAGSIGLSGLEHVSGGVDRSAHYLQIAPGRYSVTVNLMDWEAENGARGTDGKPSAGALPDFIITLTPAAPDAVFRTDIQPFMGEDARR